jgi:hypothetical protein
MLSSLDTVIAFAVIMTVLSLLITIVVQMVSAAFSLRGKNLANALALTFQTIDPNIKEHAHSLAAQILRDPIFSDSLRQKKDRSPKAVSAATEALANAERTLKDAEKKRDQATQAPAAEREAAVAAAETAVTAARAQLQAAQAAPGIEVPPVDPNRKEPWGFFSLDATKLGTAIRPGEIYRIIHEFADLSTTEAAIRDIPSELVDKSAAIIAALTKSDQLTEESKEKLQVIAGMAESFPADAQKVVVDALANLGATVERATTLAYDRFQRWFRSAQDRAEQWFQMHIRLVTVAGAIVAAFVLQLDTTEIFRKVRDNPKLVDALVKSAPGVLQQGGTVVDPNDTPAYHTYKLWLSKHPLFPITLPSPGDAPSYRKALAERVTPPQQPNKSYPVDRFNEAFARAKKNEDRSEKAEPAAVKAAYLSWVKGFPSYKLEPEPDGNTTTKESILNAIKDKIETDSRSSDAPTLLADFDALQTEGTMAFEKARSATFGDLQQKLTQAGFDLAPIPFWDRWIKEPRPRWATWCPTKWIPLNLAHILSHFLGILITAGLLALGAPFWFNLLKNLMSLRPAVANLIEKRPTSAPALPSAPGNASRI